MKISTILPISLSLFSFAAAQSQGEVGGTGTYKAFWVTESSLAAHTIYRPSTLPDEDLPIIVWGNGMCLGSGTLFHDFLREIASHGFLVIANGAPNGISITTSSMLTQSIDWAVNRANTAGQFAGRLNTSAIAVAGQSCGGLEAIEVSNDPRIVMSGIFNSGLVNQVNLPWLKRLTKPIFYVEGGESDPASANGARDWTNLPPNLPAWMGNLNVGHLATYWQAGANGGEFAKVAVSLFKWRLKNDLSEKPLFIGNPPGLTARNWEVEYKNMS